MNLPVEGEPVEFGAYVTGRFGQHLAGFASGFIWYTGMLAAWLSTSVPETIQGGPLLRFMLAQGAPILTALWGMVVFREFKNRGHARETDGHADAGIVPVRLAMIGLAPSTAAQGIGSVRRNPQLGVPGAGGLYGRR